MDLWKITDIYNRVTYYEDEKKFFRRHKYLVGEEAVEFYRHNKFGGIPTWLSKVRAYRAVNDSWVEIELPEKIKMDVGIRRIDKYNKWNERFING